MKEYCPLSLVARLYRVDLLSLAAALVLVAGCSSVGFVDQAIPDRPILVVMTDIGGDPDDMQSMRRLLLYANEFEIRGLIASSSGTPGEVEGANPRPDLINDIIDDYEIVLPNLLENADGYPSAEALRAIIASGSSERTVESIQEGAATDGSRLIAQVVDRADRPVNLTIWGGARDLAQALRDVRATRSADELANFLGKLRVYTIGDQDGYNQLIDGKHVDGFGTGKWIHDNFPELWYVETNPPERDRYASLFRGMYQNDSMGGGFAVTPLVRNGVEELNNEDWLRENVIEGHGPLGAAYPIVHQNPLGERNRMGVKEGDTPSWFYFLRTGLNDASEPTWGGWGGRFERSSLERRFIDTEDDHWSEDANEATRVKWTVARWRQAYQNDFASRMDWCVRGWAETNHPPSISINGDGSLEVIEVDAKPGETLHIDVDLSDEDGDQVSLSAWVYAEVTDVSADHLFLKWEAEGGLEVKADQAASGQTYHVILEATDSGNPALTRYRRLVVEVTAL